MMTRTALLICLMAITANVSLRAAEPTSRRSKANERDFQEQHFGSFGVPGSVLPPPAELDLDLSCRTDIPREREGSFDEHLLEIVAELAVRLHGDDPATPGVAWIGLQGDRGKPGFYGRQYRAPENLPYAWPLQVWFVSHAEKAIRLHLSLRAPHAERDLREIAADLRRRLEPAEAAARDLPKVDEELAQVDTQLAQLQALLSGRIKVAAEITGDQMKQLELDRQRLQMDFAAKEARGRAIHEQMDIAAHAATTRAASDPVVEQLKQAVALRQKELDRYREMKAAVAQGDIDKVEETLIAAKARLAEREQTLAQSPANDLLARLAEELATLAIDQAEVRTRLELIEQRLPPADLNQLDERRLAELSQIYHLEVTKDYYGPHANGSLGLQRRLKDRQTALSTRQTLLQIDSVQIIGELSPATQPAQPDRHIAKNDLLRLEVSDLQTVGVNTITNRRVDQNGDVLLPFVKEVHVEGLTEADAEQKIVETYAHLQIIQRAQVSVTIVDNPATQPGK